jgi:hypothetical protein
VGSRDESDEPGAWSKPRQAGPRSNTTSSRDPLKVMPMRRHTSPHNPTVAHLPIYGRPIGSDRVWAQAVCEVCDTVFAAPDVDCERQIHEEPGDGINSLLWEAVPKLFAARYPESGVIESYGRQWPRVSCIDFWVYIEND